MRTQLNREWTVINQENDFSHSFSHFSLLTWYCLYITSPLQWNSKRCFIVMQFHFDRISRLFFSFIFQLFLLASTRLHPIRKMKENRRLSLPRSYQFPFPVSSVLKSILCLFEFFFVWTEEKKIELCERLETQILRILSRRNFQFNSTTTRMSRERIFISFEIEIEIEMLELLKKSDTYFRFSRSSISSRTSTMRMRGIKIKNEGEENI